MTLRADGGCADLGYVRAVPKSGGQVLALYYYNDTADGERYIAATAFTPARASSHRRRAGSAQPETGAAAPRPPARRGVPGGGGAERCRRLAEHLGVRGARRETGGGSCLGGKLSGSHDRAPMLSARVPGGVPGGVAGGVAVVDLAPFFAAPRSAAAEAVVAGLGRTVALCHWSPTLHRIR